MDTKLYMMLFRVAFIVWLNLAMGMSIITYRKKDRYWLRSIVYGFNSVAVTAVLGYFSSDVLNFFKDMGFPMENIYTVVNIVMHLIMFAIALIGVIYLTKEKINACMFAVNAAYTTQIVAMMVNNIIETAFPSVRWFSTAGFGAPWTAAVYFGTYLAIFALIYLIFYRPSKNGGAIEAANFYNKETHILFLTVLLVVVIIRSMASYVKSESDNLFILMGVMVITCCMVILYVQFLLVKSVLARKETEAIRHCTELRLEQYKFTKENMDAINLKCHDLKHQLRELHSTGKIDEEWLAKLTSSVSFYDSVVKTENADLDVVLTEKSFFCTKNQIKLSVVSYENPMSFMKTADIYSFFGNALDNAIEYLMTVAPENRIVKVYIERKQGFVHVMVANYFDGKLAFEDGLPKTTKQDKNLHGFGTMSIRDVVERYEGNLMFTCKDNRFELNALFADK